MTKFISIHSYRGGTGKSNMTANLAASLALQGKRVGLVDTDIQSPGVNILFDLKDDSITRTLNDYLWGRCTLKDATYDVSAVLPEDNRQGALYLIPSSMKSEDIGRVLSEGYDVELLQTGFDEISRTLQLDYFLIDTHPGINEETLLSIGVSDSLVLILRPDQQDYLGTAVVVEVAENLDVPELFLVVNKVLSEVNTDALKQKVEATYHKPVAGILPLSTDMLRLGSQGLFCLVYPEHELTLEYQRIAQQIQG
jgi:septum site-determining protein MinD